jgi:hypothetical protein
MTIEESDEGRAVPLTEILNLAEDWPELIKAVGALAEDDRVILVNLVRQLANIEAGQGPDVAEAALECLILKLRTRKSSQVD